MATFRTACIPQQWASKVTISSLNRHDHTVKQNRSKVRISISAIAVFPPFSQQFPRHTWSEIDWFELERQVLLGYNNTFRKTRGEHCQNDFFPPLPRALSGSVSDLFRLLLPTSPSLSFNPLHPPQVFIFPPGLSEHWCRTNVSYVLIERKTH